MSDNPSFISIAGVFVLLVVAITLIVVGIGSFFWMIGVTLPLQAQHANDFCEEKGLEFKSWNYSNLYEGADEVNCWSILNGKIELIEYRLIDKEWKQVKKR